MLSLLKDNKIIGCLSVGRTQWEIHQTVFDFLRADKYGFCYVGVKNEVAIGDDDGMQVPCQLIIEGLKI